MKKRMRIMIILISVLAILLLAFLILLPPSAGKLRSFKDDQGNVIEGSIAEKTYINVGDTSLGAYILAKDCTKPVLLVCGGGPGISQYLVEYLYPSVLPEYFVVCYLDYRGTGLSYAKDIHPEDITLQVYLKDVLKVTEYLKDRFHQEKLYVLGHSFGTYIALNLVSRYPENYIAYLSMSTDADQHRSELLAYDYMLEEYEKQNNHKMVNKMKKYNPHESDEEYGRYCFSSLRDKAMHDLGVGTTRTMKGVITGLFFPSLRCRDLTISERIQLWKGKAASNSFSVAEQSRRFNAFLEVPKVEIPIYFFAGEYDYTCCESIQREYYEAIEAPRKEYFLYKDTAHSPIYEDGDYTRTILNQIL